MALEGTHIQFALDLADQYDINDMSAYLSGTVYPDSRYPSGVPRDKTHFPALLDEDFLIDDFHKGWAIHHMCDIAQAKVFNKVFEDRLQPVEKKFATPWWIKSTALKIVMDIALFPTSQIRDYIHHLSYIQSPNGEKQELLEDYNESIIRMYDKEAIDIKDAISFWLDLGLAVDVAKKVEQQTEVFFEDKINERMAEAYKKMFEVLSL